MRSCHPALSLLGASSAVGRKGLLCLQWLLACVLRAERGSAWGVHLHLTSFVHRLNGRRHCQTSARLGTDRVTCGCQAATVGQRGPANRLLPAVCLRVPGSWLPQLDCSAYHIISLVASRVLGFPNPKESHLHRWYNALGFLPQIVAKMYVGRCVFGIVYVH